MNRADVVMGVRSPRHRRGKLAEAFPAFALVALFGCAETPPTPEPPPPKVTVQHPEQRALIDYDRYNGWTEASDTVEVRARVRGHIHKVQFEDGQFVKKGDLLFELDARPFQSEIDRAGDQLAVDTAQLDFAAAEAKRDEELFKKEAITQAQLERSLASRKSWEARVESSKHEIGRRELELEYSRITAETSGRIGRALLTAGNLVNAGGSDPLLTTIAAIDPIHLYFAVDERSLLKYRERRAAKESQGTSAEVVRPVANGTSADPPQEIPAPAAADPVDDEPENGTVGAQTIENVETETAAVPTSENPEATETTPTSEVRENLVKSLKIPVEFGLETDDGYPHKGVIDFADNRIDPETGTIEVRGVAANSDGTFLPGSRVRVRVPVSDEYRAILVPDLAILSDQDQRYMLVVNDENVVVRRSLTLGRLLPDGMRVILPGQGADDGLSPADWVIVLGLQRARVNYPVEPVDADGKPVARAVKDASTGPPETAAATP